MRDEVMAAFSPEERHRLETALRRLGTRPLTVARVAQRARLTQSPEYVRNALRTDARYERIPGYGPERFRLRPEHRYLHRLKEVQARAYAVQRAIVGERGG